MYRMLFLRIVATVALNIFVVSAFQEAPLDMTKNLIIPNFRMFSQLSHVFYHPDTGHPIPMKYSKEIPGTDLLTKGFGLIPCACHREQLYCACCVFIRIQRFNFERTACSNLTVQPANLELDLTIDYSGYTLANRSLSLRHPPPFCIPTPQIPALLSCVRVHDITVREGRIEFCINFEIKVVAIPNPVFILEFTCVNYGTDGLILERPTTHHHIHDNSSSPQGSVNWNLLHSHLVTSPPNETSTTERILELEMSSQSSSSTNATSAPEHSIDKVHFQEQSIDKVNSQEQSIDKVQYSQSSETFPVTDPATRTPQHKPPNESSTFDGAPSGHKPVESSGTGHKPIEAFGSQNEAIQDMEESVHIVSLDASDFDAPVEKRSGGYLTYRGWE